MTLPVQPSGPRTKESLVSAVKATVEALYRYPFKSIQGETVDDARLESRGMVGDRAWAATFADGRVGSCRKVSIGETTRLEITEQTERCVTVTLPQPGVPRDKKSPLGAGQGERHELRRVRESHP
jgi:uncharacterized protein YcbX